MKNVIAMILVLILSGCGNNLPENSDKVESVIYPAKSNKQLLVVGLGGGEGGNAWTSDRWKKTRDRFIENGYSFLAIGYFGAKGTAEELDRISLEAVHQAIVDAANDPSVDAKKIAVIGGSKGAELALLLASYYPDINCVIGLAPSHCAFPALTLSAATSSWAYNGKEVPYVPMPWAAVPSAIKGDLRSAFEIMLEDSSAVENALIPVEKIQGPVLLISAKRDEWWPSAEMSDQIIARLKQRGFKYTFRNITIEGGHTDVLDNFDSVFTFLDKNFRSSQQVGK
jgi:dienelactone hydrolase